MINWACVPTTRAYAYICTLYKQLFEIADIDHTKTDRQFDKKKKKTEKNQQVQVDIDFGSPRRRRRNVPEGRN